MGTPKTTKPPCYICGERIIADPAVAERLGTCLPCAQELALNEDGRERLAAAVMDEDPPCEPGSVGLAATVLVCLGGAVLLSLGYWIAEAVTR